MKIVIERILNVGARWRLMNEWSASHPVRFASGEYALGAHPVGGQVYPRASVNVLETCPCQESNQDSSVDEPIFISCANGGSFCLNSCRLDTIRLCLLYVVPVVKRLVCACHNVTYLTYGASMTR